jgi:hypothetical protein
MFSNRYRKRVPHPSHSKQVFQNKWNFLTYLRLKLIQKEKDKGHLIGLATFDSDFKLLARSDKPADFMKLIKNLKPTGQNTALFDAVLRCQMELKTRRHKAQLRLILLTDGGENFSSKSAKENPALENIRVMADSAKKLQIYAEVYGIGGNLNRAKDAADMFGANFNHLTKSNVQSHVDSFLNRFPGRAELLSCLLVSVPADIPSAIHSHSATRSAPIRDLKEHSPA